MDEIEEYIRSYSRNTNNKMKLINGTDTAMRELDVETWISDIEPADDTE